MSKYIILTLLFLGVASADLRAQTLKEFQEPKNKKEWVYYFNVGTYLGKKRVLNIGAGFIIQKNAMWHRAKNGLDTLRSNLKLLAVDIFYEILVPKFPFGIERALKAKA